MTILVFGRTGQVATDLQAIAAAQRLPIMALGREQADLADPPACAAVIKTLRPSAVINAAAYTAVDRAESDERLATVINADAPSAMALACAELDIPFVHLSTDYVFPGTGDRPWQPGDPTNPCNAYGRSKLAGEIGVRAASGRYVILRTSWIFSPHGSNFAKTVLRLAATKERLRIVADQVGGPTPSHAIAQACLVIAAHLGQDRDAAGTYHFSGAPDASWYDFAKALLDHAGSTCHLEAIPSADYPTPAPRPLNSRLDCTKTQDVFGLARPDWRAAIAEIVAGQKDIA